MKIIAVLLSVLTITSSLFAFGDEFFVDSNELISQSYSNSETTVHENHHIDSKEHEQHHEDDEDHSNNSDCDGECHFCVCSCACNNIVPSVIQISFNALEVLNSKVITNYISSYSNNYLDAILQPPQV